MFLTGSQGEDLTENVFAKNNKFSKEMKPAPLFVGQNNQQRNTTKKTVSDDRSHIKQHKSNQMGIGET